MIAYAGDGKAGPAMTKERDFARRYDEQRLWLEALKSYAHDLYELFDDPKFFTQNYWFFITEVVAHTVRGNPLSKTEACAHFRVPGSSQSNGLYAASLEKGFIHEVPNGDDRRSKLVLAKPDFIDRYLAHLERTRLTTIANLRR